jgi:hypothetical protein
MKGHEMCVNIEQVEKVVEVKAKLTESQMNGQFALLHEKLDRIAEAGQKTLEQATKTNGRVNILETHVRDLQEADKLHYAKCPTSELVRNLQDDALKSTTVKTTLWQVATALGAFITFILGVFAFLAGYIKIS